MPTTDTASAHASSPSRLRAAMTADHAAIAIAFDDVVAAFRSGDRDEAAAMFTGFERRLERHLALEDDVLLPALRHDHPDEAAILAHEHRAIRVRLTELAVGIDLHLTRAAWVTDFVAMLRAHARREDTLLYRWAEERSHLDATELLRALVAV